MYHRAAHVEETKVFIQVSPLFNTKESMNTLNY